MGLNPKSVVIGVVGGLLAGLVARKVLPRDLTDVDFRPPPRPGPDVIAGWERRPHVPVSEDQVR